MNYTEFAMDTILKKFLSHDSLARTKHALLYAKNEPNKEKRELFLKQLFYYSFHKELIDDLVNVATEIDELDHKMIDQLRDVTKKMLHKDELGRAKKIAIFFKNKLHISSMLELVREKYIINGNIDELKELNRLLEIEFKNYEIIEIYIGAIKNFNNSIRYRSTYSTPAYSNGRMIGGRVRERVINKKDLLNLRNAEKLIEKLDTKEIIPELKKMYKV